MSGFEPVYSALFPHPPIVIPEVGRERHAQCRDTHDACRELARRALESRPERMLLISPHAPRFAASFGVTTGRLRGDLGRFGAPEVMIDLPGDPELSKVLLEEARRRRLPLEEIPAYPLDHGSSVPLAFLTRAGWSGPTTVVALPAYLTPGDASAFGRLVRDALDGRFASLALIASGDCTHRAIPGAPAGYHPEAVRFDEALVEAIRSGRIDQVGAIDPELRDLAAEDVVDSVAIAAAAIGDRPREVEVLSYEHPFGVGYLVAQLHRRAATPSGIDVLPGVARDAVSARLEGRPVRDVPLDPELDRRACVFVTLRDAAGRLRGCIGSNEPLTPNLIEETRGRAIAAAFHDPRFPPLTAGELPECTFEVSVLGEREPVSSIAELDPARFGVVVQDHHGRRGVLLPGIEGIDTPEQQIQIARRKAGIPEGEPVDIERFTVQKAVEQRGASAR